MQARIVRTPLPVGLIRRMDQLILAGVGGFETRHEFIREAIENLAAELAFDEAPKLGRLDGIGDRDLVADLRQEDHRDVRSGPEPAAGLAGVDKFDWAASAIDAPEPGPFLQAGIQQVDGNEPLYGLHNRDYPSIWAARALVAVNGGHPLPFTAYVESVMKDAWQYGKLLRHIGDAMGARTTYLFPTNFKKPQSAEEGFKAFAIGTVIRSDSVVKAGGPLFVWRLAHLEDREGELFIGPSQHLYDLLRGLDGITVREPHDPAYAQVFFDHIRRLSPGDWWGLRSVFVLADGRARPELLEGLSELRPQWSQSQVQTNAAGYVARLREWGLLEPKLDGGVYLATEFGRNAMKAWTEAEE